MSRENILFSFSAEQAEKHFAEELYQIFTYGEPMPNMDEMHRYLRKHYQVEMYWTGGCCQSVENTEKLDEYSDRMTELLIQKFGKDIFEEAYIETGGTGPGAWWFEEGKEPEAGQ